MKSIQTALALLALPLLLGATTLRLVTGGDVTSLDPHKISGTWENIVEGDLFEGLMTEDPWGRPILGNAKKYEISKDGLVYTFTLKDHLKWSNGSALTAKDYEYAFKRLFNPQTAANYAWLQFPIKNAQAYNAGQTTADQVGVKATDSKTLVMTLEQPTPYFLSMLTHYTAYPIPKAVVEKYGPQWVKIDHIITNGPYKPVEWVPGSHVKAVINPHYYAASSLKIDTVVYAFIEDENTAYRGFKAGEYDYIPLFPKDLYPTLKKTTPEVLKVTPYAGLYYYAFNTKVQPFDDPSIRQALSMSINREIIANQINANGERPAYALVPPGMNHYSKGARVKWASLPYKDRITAAKHLLAKKGFTPTHPLSFTLSYNTMAGHKRVAIAIAAMWKALGLVKVKLHNTEVKVHYANMQNGQFQVGRAGWIADYNDPEAFLALFQTGYGENYGQYSNAGFDALMKKAAAELNLTKRAHLLRKAEQMLLDDSALIPIYYYVTSDLVSKQVKGFENNLFDIHRTRWLSK